MKTTSLTFLIMMVIVFFTSTVKAQEDVHIDIKCHNQCWTASVDCHFGCAVQTDTDLDICFEMCFMDRDDCIDACVIET
ncbi:hypothetical protein LSAT2_026396 [Lamellibrachia satsuma]|nr:hypothetical protein LSAT2_026396 [Lamellibrachia satsuma]